MFSWSDSQILHSLEQQLLFRFTLMCMHNLEHNRILSPSQTDFDLIGHDTIYFIITAQNHILHIIQKHNFFLQAGHLEVKVLLQRKILGIFNTMTQK